MANQKLSEIVKKYNEAKVWAKKDLSNWDPKTSKAAGTQQNMAREQLAVLTNEYCSAVRGRFVKVFLTGEGETFDKVKEYCSQESAPVVDGNLVYNSLAKTIQNTVYGSKTFSAQQFAALVHATEDLALKNELEIPPPQWDGFERMVPTFNDLAQNIKKCIRRTNGDALNNLLMSRFVYSQALEKGMDYNLVPVIITNVTKEEVETFSNTMFQGQPNVVIEVKPEDKFDDVIENLNGKLQAAYAELKVS